MAEEKKVNNEATETKVDETEVKEETKGNEPEDQAEDNQDKGAENPPAKTDDKKGFHPIQALKNKVAEFSENNPKVVSGVKTVGKVAGGVVIGAVGTVAVLASIAAKKGIEENQDDDSCDDEDDNIIDTEGNELDDSDDSES